MPNLVIGFLLVQKDNCTVFLGNLSIVNDGLGKACVIKEGSPRDKTHLIAVDKGLCMIIEL